MVGRKKKPKTCDKRCQVEDMISKLSDIVLSEKILSRVSTKDAVRTSVLSTKWRNLWQSVPGLDLDSRAFWNFHDFVSFVDRFFDSHRWSCILKLKLSIHDSNGAKLYLNSWIDDVTRHKIEELDVCFDDTPGRPSEIPLSIYTCENLVKLQLYWAALVSADFFYLPCLKIMHLECIRDLNESTMEKLIQGSPSLEDLTIIESLNDNGNYLQVRSGKLKRIRIDGYTKVVIEAPLLQCLETVMFFETNFNIIGSDFPLKLDIGKFDPYSIFHSVQVRDILTDVSKVTELVISSDIWKEIFMYSKSEPLLQFPYLSRLNARYFKSHLELLPTLLESCPKLESLILEEKKYRHHTKYEGPNVMFSTVPWCLVSSLKFVELRPSRWISDYEGEMELVRYFLQNSSILEKLKLDNYYYKEKEKYAILAMPRCSIGSEVLL